MFGCSARADTIAVTTTDDSGPNSLRAALAGAADGDMIDASSVTGTILLITGQLSVSNSVSIVGPGPDKLVVNGNAPNVTDRVLSIAPGTTVSISGFAITNGSAPGGPYPGDSGGGIFVEHANLTISNCAISGNSAGYAGGGIFHSSADGVSGVLTILNCTLDGNTAGTGAGIYNYGQRSGSPTLTILNSTLTRNSASHSGGGIYNDGDSGSATLIIVNSLLDSNWAVFGGGVYNDGEYWGGGTLEIGNSTLSGNQAVLGGGIYNNGYLGNTTLKIANCTFGRNSASEGGAILNNPVTAGFSLEIGNTILDAGASGENLYIQQNLNVLSRGYNLCSDNGAGYLTATGDQTNTVPRLGPLQDNGGQSLTHALLCESPAMDQGKLDTIPSMIPDADQRTFARIVDDPGIANAVGGDGSDIGAFESQGSGALRAKCKDVEVPADAGCTAVALIDDGSSKPDAPCETLTLSQSPPGPYTLGVTMVTLTVTDDHGGTDSCTVAVTVFDDTPPVITCPSPQSAAAISPAGAVVSYPAPGASDNCSVSAVCVPASGSVFPIGDTTVTCTATDGSGYTNSCMFSVHVQGVTEQLADALAKIDKLGLDATLARNLTKRIERIGEEFADGESEKACVRLTKLITFVTKRQSKGKLTEEQAEELTTDIARIRGVMGCT